MSLTLGHGKICYLELPAVEVRESARFYVAVFGWSVRDRGDGALSFDDGVGQVSGVWVTARFRDPAGNILGLYEDPSFRKQRIP